jgi:hypothetical protein
MKIVRSGGQQVSPRVRIGCVDGWLLDAAATDSGELQREAQQPGRDENKRAQWAEREAGQFEDQSDEEQDGGDDGQHGGLLNRPRRYWVEGRALPGRGLICHTPPDAVSELDSP